MSNEKQQISYKDTLNLPRTDFPIRPNPKEDDAQLLNRWEQEQLYEKATAHNAGEQSFILHDGPPYANGHIHLGHAYNKVLKDMITKAHRMMGHHVPVVPGWDCHGLPIEFKVTQENPGLTGPALKKKCREYAQHWVAVQREEFKKLGVIMDWEHPYLTMDPSYEAAIVRAFGTCVDYGYIERKNKTVPWCASCQTVLAAAEIEYHDRKDPSIYVQFPLAEHDARALMPDSTLPVSLLVWTTTPWTLPLNRAVVLRPQTMYAIIEHNNQYFVVGAALAERVCQLAQIPCTITKTIAAEELAGASVQHPLIDTLTVPVLLDDFVSLDDGTACVHCAPGCGPQDYDVAVKNGLEVFSPLSIDGKYTSGIEPQLLEGMSIADGQRWVLQTLSERGNLFLKKSITHSFPHCWRCRNPLMFRATKQWFCDLSHNALRERALTALESITFLPEKAKNSLKAALASRLEWCLSRQRVWGVPIPALLCTACGTEHFSSDMIERIAAGIERDGIEFWDTVTIDQLIDASVSCRSCGGRSFTKETDILDVWFDSGVSHYAVLSATYGLSYPADLYLEGRDQARGWFQSSLLTSLILNTDACMRAILTHGYTVDEQGRKMSKSIGNVVSPQQLIDQLGTDGLRLWVASIDYADDAVISSVLIKNVQEVYRKLRNTCRFLLLNLYDFDYTHDVLPFERLKMIDQYALSRARAFNEECIAHYRNADFTAVYHALNDFCTVFLSSLYLDVIKDRLYVEKADGFERRSAQTVCWYMLDTITKLMAPIASFTAELVSDEYQKEKSCSIHLQRFVQQEFHTVPVAAEYWQLLHRMRDALLKAIEEQRAQGIIKHSLEAGIVMHVSLTGADGVLWEQLCTALKQTNQSLNSFLKEWLIVSQVDLAPDAQGLIATTLSGLSARVTHAAGVKCPRCWQWSVSMHSDNLCERCIPLV